MKKILIISFLFLSFNAFGQAIQDYNPWSSIKKNLDDINIKSIIVKSSNIGAARIVKEIEGIENEIGCDANIVWEYSLPEDLFGFASGNVQKLDTGNYLITTVGGGGTSLEVTPNNNVVWEANYNLSLPNGAVYRANRASGLYPVAYSVIVEDMYLDGSNMIVDDGLNVRLYNNGTAREIFYIPIALVQ